MDDNGQNGWDKGGGKKQSIAGSQNRWGKSDAEDDEETATTARMRDGGEGDRKGKIYFLLVFSPL